jgi:hypothetical protein
MASEIVSIKVYLGEGDAGKELKQRWLAYCENEGLKPGATIREAMIRELVKAEAIPGGRTYQQVEDGMAPGSMKRFEILLSDSEKQAIKERSESEGCSQRRWILDSIRARLTHEPQFQMKEIEILGESNYQLLSIGRNLNQVARVMNEGYKDSITIDAIQKLRKIIDVHTEKVSMAIRASVERWSIR